MNAYLVDDEKNSREVLRELIRNFSPELVILGEAGDIDTAYTEIKNLEPDLVFLDIQMPNGNGFNLLRRFEHIPFEVIFVTSYDQFAIDAIKFNALDYLLKPISIDLFKQSIDKARQSYRRRTQDDVRFINLIHTIDQEPNEERKIVAHQNDKVVLVKISSIIYLEAEINYTHLFTEDKQKYTISKSIKEFERFLEPIDTFVRIHRKYIVNTSFIRSYSKNDPFTVTLEGGTELEASRRKKSDLLAILFAKGENL